MFTSYRSNRELIKSQTSLFPAAKPNSYPTRHRPSIITQPQVTKILRLLKTEDDKLRTLNEFLAWNKLTANEQFIQTAQGYRDDVIEVSLGANGCTIKVTLFPLEDHQINLSLDPDTDIVIQEVAL